MRRRSLGWLICAPLLLLAGQVAAQSIRDPTLPPAGVGAPVSVEPSNTVTLDIAQMTIIVRDGRPQLWLNAELYSEGQNLGEARIEHISETEVWLREKGVLRKVSLFPDIQRTPLLPTEKTLHHQVDPIEAQSPRQH